MSPTQTPPPRRLSRSALRRWLRRSTPVHQAPSPAGGPPSSIPTAPTSVCGSLATATVPNWSNYPGTWDSSDLSTNNPDRAKAFYGAIFGWLADPVDFGGGEAEGESFIWRLPGYGDFLAIRDPDIKRRHADASVPDGFSDAIGWMTAVGDAVISSHWSVTFSVADTDALAERAVKLGGTVVSPPADRGGGLVRIATIRDPQGAEFTVGSYDPTAANA